MTFRAFVKAAALSLGLAGLGGCATYTSEVKEMTSAYTVGNYPAALASFEKAEVLHADRNRMLTELERGSILERMGRRKEARAAWLKADSISDQLFTTSVSKSAVSFLYNDSAQAYPGEDYEKVALHAMLAHSFLRDGESESARVEAARINTRLNEINNFYEDNKNKYRDDAYARYLSGLIYESRGEQDNAIVDYRASLKIYETDYQERFETRVPADLVRALYRLFKVRGRDDEAKRLADQYKKIDFSGLTADTASIAVIHEIGVINPKIAQEFMWPIGGQVVRFSFPAIKKQGVSVRATGFRLNDGPLEPAELAQNYNAIAYQSLEDRRMRLILKSGARLLLKGQLTQKAEKEFGAVGWIAGNIYGAVTETADTRGWTTLPAAFYISRSFGKAGSYELTFQNNGRVSDVQKATVRPGSLALFIDTGSKMESSSSPDQGKARADGTEEWQEPVVTSPEPVPSPPIATTPDTAPKL